MQIELHGFTQGFVARSGAIVAMAIENFGHLEIADDQIQAFGV